MTLLPARGDLTMSWRGTVQFPACSDRDCSGERHHSVPKRVFQIGGAETPEGRIPGRALALHFVGAARDIPAFHDFLQEAVGQEAFAMRARQVSCADGGCPIGGLKLVQEFQRLCEFFRRCGHGISLFYAGCKYVFIILLCCTKIILLRSTFIILFRCTIIILLRTCSFCATTLDRDRTRRTPPACRGRRASRRGRSVTNSSRKREVTALPQPITHRATVGRQTTSRPK